MKTHRNYNRKKKKRFSYFQKSKLWILLVIIILIVVLIVFFVIPRLKTNSQSSVEVDNLYLVKPSGNYSKIYSVIDDIKEQGINNIAHLSVDTLKNNIDKLIAKEKIRGVDKHVFDMITHTVEWRFKIDSSFTATISPDNLPLSEIEVKGRWHFLSIKSKNDAIEITYDSFRNFPILLENMKLTPKLIEYDIQCENGTYLRITYER